MPYKMYANSDENFWHWSLKKKKNTTGNEPAVGPLVEVISQAWPIRDHYEVPKHGPDKLCHTVVP